MISRDRPNAFRLLFVWQGSIIPQILPQLLMVIGLSALLLLLNNWTAHLLPDVPLTAFSLIGLTLSIFLAFRNNACYERWWEARKLLGMLIAQVRHLDRDSSLLSDNERHKLMHYVLVFSYALHARLRQHEISAEIKHWTDDKLFAQLQQHSNAPQYVLTQAQQLLKQAMQKGQLSDICYVQLNSHLINIADVQAGCDRILSTPLPFAYSLLLHRTAYLFCLLLPFSLASSLGLLSPIVVGLLAYTFFGLDVLGDELEDPFGTAPNDLPLDAILRSIEIDILTGLNASDIPAPLQPVRHILS